MYQSPEEDVATVLRGLTKHPGDYEAADLVAGLRKLLPESGLDPSIVYATYERIAANHPQPNSLCPVHLLCALGGKISGAHPEFVRVYRDIFVAVS